MQTISSWIWTRATGSISSDDNSYAKRAYLPDIDIVAAKNYYNDNNYIRRPHIALKKLTLCHILLIAGGLGGICSVPNKDQSLALGPF